MYMVLCHAAGGAWWVLRLATAVCEQRRPELQAGRAAEQWDTRAHRLDGGGTLAGSSSALTMTWAICDEGA